MGVEFPAHPSMRSQRLTGRKVPRPGRATVGLPNAICSLSVIAPVEYWEGSSVPSEASARVFLGAAADILERISEGFYAIDADWRLLHVNAHAESFWQRSRGELVGRTMFSLFPAFEGSPAHTAHQRAFEGCAHVRAEVISTATGLPVELNIYRDANGLSVYFRDVSARLDLERRLRERDEILSLAEASAGIGVWDADLATETLRGTPEFFRLHGLEPVEEPVSFEVTRTLRHPEDRDRVRTGFKETIAGGGDSYETEYRIIRPDGSLRWIFGRGRVFRDTSGAPVRYSGVDIDITERKRQEDLLRVMTRELRHRANNLFAVVQAVARQTARASADIADFQERFDGRVASLAQSNEMLVEQDWRGVPLEALVRRQLKPFVEGEHRLSVAGPSLDLVPGAVQTIGLALHELATNAAKYGALSLPSGRVEIVWEVSPETDGDARFHLQWRESGGPPVAQPDRSGFGRFVTETMVATTLGADVSVAFAEEGLVWSMECSVADIAVA